jgi:hypothetical protein
MKSSIFSKLAFLNESTHRGLERVNESKEKIHAIATSTKENISHGFESASESVRGITDKLDGMKASIVGVFTSDTSVIKSSKEKVKKSVESYALPSFPKSITLANQGNTEKNHVENQPTPIKTDKNPTVEMVFHTHNIYLWIRMLSKIQLIYQKWLKTKFLVNPSILSQNLHL